MKSKTLTILALLAVAAGCMGTQETTTETTSTTITNQNPTTTTPKPQATTTTTPREPEFEPTGTTIKQPLNASACYLLTNVTEHDTCLSDAAGRDRDITLCENITESNARFKCRARLEDKPEHCDNIDLQREKNQCYWMMAFRWKKIGYCKQILMNQNMAEKCILDYIRSVGDPAGAPGKYAGECLSMGNITVRDQCILHYINVYNQTQAGGIKPTLCHLIEDGTLEARCNQTYLQG